MNISKRFCFLLICTALCTGPARAAEELPDCPDSTYKPRTFVADANTGCKVWDPDSRVGATVSYAGGCVDGYAQGNGAATWFAQGRKFTTFTGTWQRGKLQGMGSEHSLCSVDNVYKGSYRDSVREGWGVLTYGTSYRYEGNFHNDRQNGQGKLVDDNGTYQSSFVNGEPSGRGVISWGLGDHYEGEFTEGRPGGQGVYTSPDGRRYVGQMAKGRFWGQGVLTFRDGAHYEGNFADDEFDGHGVMTLANGDRYEGEWTDGNSNGHGILTYHTGERFEGNFVQGKREGRGLTVSPDGKRSWGMYHEDQRVGDAE